MATVSVLQLKSISFSLVLASIKMGEQNKKFGKYAAAELASTKEYDDNIGSDCWKVFQKDCTVYQGSKYVLQISVVDSKR